MITSVIKTIFPETIRAQAKLGLPNVDGGSDFDRYILLYKTKLQFAKPSTSHTYHTYLQFHFGNKQNRWKDLPNFVVYTLEWKDVDHTLGTWVNNQTTPTFEVRY